MRIHLKINSSNQIIPFDHQPLLVGTIHKWLGHNDVHGEVALFSFSRLEKGKNQEDGLKFTQGTSFFISAYDASMIKKLVSGIQRDPTMFCGLTVMEIIIEEDPNLTNRELFYIASPIFISRRIGDKIEQIFFDDSRASGFLKETLETKMGKVGMYDDSFEIHFDFNCPNAGTKMITYKGIKNKANWCSVIIKGKPETKLFAWNVGLGNSTGIGFGAIK